MCVCVCVWRVINFFVTLGEGQKQSSETGGEEGHKRFGNSNENVRDSLHLIK